MMTSPLAVLWVHTVTVRTRLGQNALGDLWAEPVTVPCFLNDAAHLVRGVDDEDVVSQTVLYADLSYANLFVADSIVTAGGRDARVITVNANDAGQLPLPAHVEVHLT